MIDEEEQMSMDTLEALDLRVCGPLGSIPQNIGSDRSGCGAFCQSKIRSIL